MSILITRKEVKNMANEKLRGQMKKKRVYQWQIADVLGVHEVTVCKQLRTQLDKKTEKEYYAAIDEILKKRKGEERD